MKKFIVHHRSPHHAQYSGYGRLLDYLEQPVLIPSGSSLMPYPVAKWLSKRCQPGYGTYDSNSVLKEWQLFWTLVSSLGTSRMVHYLNGERDIRYVKQLAQTVFQVPVVATFHKPPLVLEQTLPHFSFLKGMAGAIAVGPNQVDFLKNRLETDAVSFIPHGIDTTFFSPASDVEPDACHLLFVGQHLRDFEALAYVVPRLAQQLPHLQVTVVLRSEFARFVPVHSCIRVLSGVSDVDLLHLYRRATALFLPLKDSTACNSILEAIACGLPTLTTDVGGVRGYLDETTSVLVPPNAYDDLYEATLSYLQNPDLQMQLRRALRTSVSQFSWEQVAAEVSRFYSQFEV
ncbi:glycosyltransferase family 4 protein [Flavobacterium sp.]|uniref:glycosyltransferase family 4 protein n=1 Tax=Flavobacterium sp. TaxID=239 RepID=UPI002FDB19F5